MLNQTMQLVLFVTTYNLQPCICYNRDRFNRVQLYIMYGQLLSHKMVVTNLLQLLMTIISNQTNTDIFVTRLLIVFVFFILPTGALLGRVVSPVQSQKPGSRTCNLPTRYGNKSVLVETHWVCMYSFYW